MLFGACAVFGAAAGFAERGVDWAVFWAAGLEDVGLAATGLAAEGFCDTAGAACG